MGAVPAVDDRDGVECELASVPRIKTAPSRLVGLQVRLLVYRRLGIDGDNVYCT